MKRRTALVVFTFLITSSICAQEIYQNVPITVSRSHTYVFYLHGGIVQAQGENAVSDLFGPYKYRDILKTLKQKGFSVISEVRPKETNELEYAQKVSFQIDTLLAKGISKENIVIIGASLGAYITVELANIRKDPEMRYVLIGLCSDYALELFAKYKNHLCGDFLSIYETSDQKTSCMPILDNDNCKTGVKEISTNMGIGHGFLYQPYDDWVLPMVTWIEK